MRIILATCSPDEAAELVRAMLSERLIGCANVVPGVQSHYWWEGEICSDTEVLLLMETSAARVNHAAERLKELHSYDVPKIVILDPSECDADYLSWLNSVTARPPP